MIMLTWWPGREGEWLYRGCHFSGRENGHVIEWSL